VKRVLSVFVHAKARMHPQHQFALCILKDTAVWLQDFTSDPDRVVDRIQKLETAGLFKTVDLTSLFNLINSKVECFAPAAPSSPSPAPYKYAVRSIFVYGRSSVLPTWSGSNQMPGVADAMLKSPIFFFDALYLHDKPTENNRPQEVYDVITGIENENVVSYFFENSTNPKRLYNHISLLLAHPLQRPDQNDLKDHLDAQVPVPESPEP